MSMYNPLISIIVPIYNREKTLDVCINGILASKYKNIEVVLVDDGSTDKSLEKCHSYAKADNRVVVVSQKNQGVSVARNAGVKASKGEWVTFVDSDDTVMDIYFDKLVSNGDLEHVDMTLVGRCPGKIKNGVAVQLIQQKESIVRKIEGSAEIVKFLFGDFNPYKNSFYHSTDKLFRRSILIENDLWYLDDISLSEDQIFVLNYLRHAKGLYYDSMAYYLHFNWLKNTNTSSLGRMLRTPEYFLKVQKANYDAFEHLYTMFPDKGLKEYEVNYILDRPISKILYNYTLWKNIAKYSYKKLKLFTIQEILPILSKESDNIALLHNDRIASFNKALFSNPFWFVYVRIFLYSNFSYYMWVIKLSVKKILGTLINHL